MLKANDDGAINDDFDDELAKTSNCFCILKYKIKQLNDNYLIKWVERKESKNDQKRNLSLHENPILENLDDNNHNKVRNNELSTKKQSHDIQLNNMNLDQEGGESGGKYGNRLDSKSTNEIGK